MGDFDFAKLVTDYGMAVAIAIGFLIIVFSALWIGVGALRKWASSQWVRRSDVLKVARTLAPHEFRPNFSDNPKLAEHPVFGEFQRMYAVAATLTVGDTGSPSRTALARDLLVALLAGYQKAMENFIAELNATLVADGPQTPIPAEAFGQSFLRLCTTANLITAGKLEDAKFPLSIWSSWCASREDAEQAGVEAAEMIAYATTENYPRAHAFLSLLYVRIRSTRRLVEAHIVALPRVEAYTRAITRSELTPHGH